MTRKTQKHGYEAPEIKFLELDQTGGGFCTSQDITNEAKENYGSELYNWD